MRHRFHSICPYFAMFPEAFVAEQLRASDYRGVVFDPFCGRGTTMLEAQIGRREAAGCDVNPVAVCISGAKCDPPTRGDVANRIEELRHDCHEPSDRGWQGELDEFFGLCFHTDTMTQVRYLRAELEWRRRREDRFIAAVCLGALHGESHRSPNYFGNRLPRTISTKPEYSVQWWRRRKSEPPRRDVFEIVERVVRYRFESDPAPGRGTVREADARDAAAEFPELEGRVTDVITSPPYLDTTDYREDQWLRLWFLGGEPRVRTGGGDERHGGKNAYWTFMEEAASGLAPLLAGKARIVVRIGGRRFGKAELRDGLHKALTRGLGRQVAIEGEGLTSKVPRTQAESFRGGKISKTVEHDFVFFV